MRYVQFEDGLSLPVMGFGTYTFGGSLSPSHKNDREEIEKIRMAIDLGYTHFDTAEMYGGGHSEELLGQAMKGVARDSLFITSKVSPSHAGKRAVTRALEESLERLGTDYLDLYLLHWPTSTVPLSETFSAFNRALREGKTRYIGVSNFGLEQMREAAELCEGKLLTNQVEYSLLERSPEKNGVLRYCQENDMVLTAYEPLAKGRLPGQRRYEDLAKKAGLTVAQLALAWLLSKDRVITIPKTENPDHMKENFEAADLSLDPDILRELESI